MIASSPRNIPTTLGKIRECFADVDGQMGAMWRWCLGIRWG